MELWQLALLVAAGFAAGWINVLAGGGSLLTIPALLFLGIPAPVANGTNRIAIIAQSISSVTAFRKGGFSDFRLSATLSVAATIGAVIGAMIGVKLDGVWFNRVLAVTMLGVLVLMINPGGGTQKAGSAAAPGQPRNLALGHILMIGAGFWGGFIQVGLGFLVMPILHRVMGIDLVRVNMHKVFIALIISIAALAIFAANVPIVWKAGLALAVGNAVGGWVGASSSIKGGEKLIKRVFYACLGAIIVKLLFFPG